MAISSRWPLHPRPQLHESLSSWLCRLAKEYNLSVDELLSNTLSTQSLSSRLIDRDPPDHLIAKLTAYTGLDDRSIRAMTLQVYVPWIIDTLDNNNSECLKQYATQYRTLLPSKVRWIISSRIRKRYSKNNIYCLPWILEPYGREYPLCVECLRTDPIPYKRIFWRLGIMASCPIHQCLLDASDYRVARLIPACIPIEPADENLLYVDKLTLQALTIGEVTLANERTMSAAVYVRFLRSLIAEICCPFSIARRCNDMLLDIWDHVDIDFMFWRKSLRSMPFERLSLPQRRDILKVIGFLLHDIPRSLMMWQATATSEQEEKRKLPGAILGAFDTHE